MDPHNPQIKKVDLCVASVELGDIVSRLVFKCHGGHFFEGGECEGHDP